MKELPGTWKLGKRAGNPAIYGKDGEEIAEMLHVLNDEWRDNARLICAAPDLLQVAKDFVLLCELHDLEGAVLDSAKEAIANAERGEA
jgi:hypothetical protein